MVRSSFFLLVSLFLFALIIPLALIDQAQAAPSSSAALTLTDQSRLIRSGLRVRLGKKSVEVICALPIGKKRTLPG